MFARVHPHDQRDDLTGVARPHAASRLTIDGRGLVANWKSLAALAPRASCGAAIKANGYGLGAREVATRLAKAGCRDFFVATWAEALEVADCGARISVLHGARSEDMRLALAMPGVKPVLSTPDQVRRWREHGTRPCDIMIDTGMNRLGVSAQHVAEDLLAGLNVDILMSHLAGADEVCSDNETQLAIFRKMTDRVAAQRFSLANSAGVMLGPDYHFDLVRPGIALYGGTPCRALAEHIRPVVEVNAQVIQRRRVPRGETVGYNGTWKAMRDTDIAIIHLGYADGYRRALANGGSFRVNEYTFPVIGRISMDMTAIDVSAWPELVEGQWVSATLPLGPSAAQSEISEYELLVGLGNRLERRWVD